MFVGMRQLPGRTLPTIDASTSAIVDIGAGRVLLQQCGGLLTVTASSSRTAASCISEFTLLALNGPSSQSEVNGGFQLTATVRLGTPNDELSGSLTLIHTKGWP
ncbi:hypothetical protein SAMN05446934_1315 [Paraburkholderia hospita]|nr:hypothetical protein SAMN05446934_1315 [Paraburkholderia hospita]